MKRKLIILSFLTAAAALAWPWSKAAPVPSCTPANPQVVLCFNSQDPRKPGDAITLVIPTGRNVSAVWLNDKPLKKTRDYQITANGVNVTLPKVQNSERRQSVEFFKVTLK